MRIVLSGAETSLNLRTLIKSGAKYVAMNYYYMYERQDKGVHFLQDAKEAGLWVLLTSGASTLRKKYPWVVDGVCTSNGQVIPGCGYTAEQVKTAKERAGVSSKAKVIDLLEDYRKHHTDFVRDHAELIGAFSELDLDDIVGEDIWEWRDYYADEVDLFKTEMIVTPHSVWDDRLWSGEYTYVGLDLTTDSFRTTFAKHRNKIEPRKIKLHGWGRGDDESIQKLPYFSVDSSNWITAKRYGNTYHHKGGKTFVQVKKEKRQELLPEAERIGVDVDGLKDGDGQAIGHWNACQWASYSREMAKDVSKAYWLSAEEKATARKETALQKAPSSLVDRHSKKDIVQAAEAKALDYARTCNHCFIKDTCPAHEEDATCSLFERIDVASPDAVKNLLTTLLGVQAERTIFASFAEKIRGEVLDEQVSTEMEKTMEMLQRIKELTTEKTSLTIQAEGKEGTGVISQLLGNFGGQQKAQQAEQADIIDAQIVEDEEK